MLGAEAWPGGLAEFAGRFNARTGPRPPVAADLSDPAAWRGLELPPDTDMAVAVVAAPREGAAERWYLYSPILRRVQRLDLAPRHERNLKRISYLKIHCVSGNQQGV